MTVSNTISAASAVPVGNAGHLVATFRYQSDGQTKMTLSATTAQAVALALGAGSGSGGGWSVTTNRNGNIVLTISLGAGGNDQLVLPPSTAAGVANVLGTVAQNATHPAGNPPVAGALLADYSAAHSAYAPDWTLVRGSLAERDRMLSEDSGEPGGHGTGG